jgi:uroporphyrinogen-III decarboxylase
MTRIVSQLQKERDGRHVPVILFTKGGGQWLEAIADSGCDALGLDWTTDMGLARQQVGQRVGFQGNMDPSVLYMHLQMLSELKSGGLLIVLALIQAMYSIWGMALHQRFLRSMPGIY